MSTCGCHEPATFGHSECPAAAEWDREDAQAAVIEERLEAARFTRPGWEERSRAGVARDYCMAEAEAAADRGTDVLAGHAEWLAERPVSPRAAALVGASPVLDAASIGHQPEHALEAGQ